MTATDPQRPVDRTIVGRQAPTHTFPVSEPNEAARSNCGEVVDRAMGRFLQEATIVAYDAYLETLSPTRY